MGSQLVYNIQNQNSFSPQLLLIELTVAGCFSKLNMKNATNLGSVPYFIFKI